MTLWVATFPDTRLLLLLSLLALTKTVSMIAVASLCLSFGKQCSKAIAIACVKLIGGDKDNNSTNDIAMLMLIGDGGEALFWRWRG